MHIDNVIFLILSKIAYTKFSEGPFHVRMAAQPTRYRLHSANRCPAPLDSGQAFFFCPFLFKFQFIVQCAVDTVGAIIDRPRRETLRIRIGFRRIRNSLPLRALDKRPYIHHRDNSININLPICNEPGMPIGVPETPARPGLPAGAARKHQFKLGGFPSPAAQKTGGP